MSGIGKCAKIRHIVRLRQMLRQWRKKAAMGGRLSQKLAGLAYIAGDDLSVEIPADVPAGHLAVHVGSTRRRFVVRASYLNHPVFRKLLTEAEEVYGFDHQGPLMIPCDETIFEEILRYLARNEANASSSRFVNPGNCSMGSRNFDCRADSRPLLQSFAEKSIG